MFKTQIKQIISYYNGMIRKTIVNIISGMKPYKITSNTFMYPDRALNTE